MALKDREAKTDRWTIITVKLASPSNMMQLLYSIRDYRAGWAPGLLCLILLGYRYSGTARAVLKSRQVFRIVVVVLTVTYALTAILYLLYSNYIDHFEATVSTISWLGTHGHLIYPDWQTGHITIFFELSTVEGYISVMLMTANHGLKLSLLIENLLFALLLFAPIVFTLHFRRPALDAFDSWFVGGLFVSLAMTTIVASKPGAGTHHFLPLVPISICVLLSVLQAPASRLAPELNPRDGLHPEKQCQEECIDCKTT
jgi:hypothetical protein